MTRRVVVEADGGSRGNPGPAGYGTVVRDGDTGEVLAEVAESIGTATNNVAEYRGIIAGLTAARDLGADVVDVRMDSKLVVEQLSGRWQVKHPDMKPLALEAMRLVRGFERVTFTWIPREHNKHADALANQAMDDAAAGRPWERRVAASPIGGPEGEVPQPEPESAAPNRFVGFMPEEAPPTRLLAIRHGETTHSVAKRFAGSSDVPLTERGEAMARATAARLAARGGVSAVVCSPLQRARATAEVIAAAVGCAVAVDDDLRECDFGEWEGLTFAEVQERDADALTSWLADVQLAPPGGESFAAVHRRVRRARDRVLAAHPGGTVAVVAHVTPIKLLVGLALEAPPVSLYRLHIDPCSYTELEWYADGPAVLRVLNDTSHLAGI